jgi:crotonobetainyl-CoA:carnitine CoA-transferase CaiB-like acyl-CoA transferase
MTDAQLRAARAVIDVARGQGIAIDVAGGVILLSGRAPLPVRAAWRPTLERHREAIVALLGAPAASAGAQRKLPGVDR